MKHIIKIFLTLIVLVSFNSCVESDNVIDDVLEYETGAVLRTIEVMNSTLNSSVPDSEWRVLLEEQDELDGDLFAAVSVHVSLRDLTPDNGTTVAEGHVKTIPASAFSTGPVGLPRGEVAATFAEAEAAMGLSPEDTSPGDLYIFEVRLELTDGRIFGASSAAGIITGGYFSSPFQYNTLIVCSPQPGDYTIVMIDNYGDGWQGDSIRVNVDGTETDYALPSYWDCTANCGGVGDPQWSEGTAIATIPAGAELGTFEYISGDFPGEVEFEIFYPDGTSAGYFGPSAAPGLLPVLQCAQ